MQSTHLISIYLTVSEYYSTMLAGEVQRFSNNFCPKFTDEEAITCYIFGILEQKLKVKDVYNFIRDYWADWFPNLPSYQKFSKRLNYLAPAFEHLAMILLGMRFSAEINDFLLDSFPIVVANSRRSNRANAASDLCDKGYCASKNMYFYGLKLHSLGQSQYHTMPKMHIFRVTPASYSDLAVAKDMLQTAQNITVYADKAYIDSLWQAELALRNVEIRTPVKLKKGQKALDSADKLWSCAVSSVRQPIESFFAWLQDKTQIQFASKVRSSGGLIAFVFARIAAAALLFLNW